jgi:hypothetical protein
MMSKSTEKQIIAIRAEIKQVRRDYGATAMADLMIKNLEKTLIALESK